MPFELTSDQELIRKTVQEFTAAELPAKVADKLDRAREFPRDLVGKLAGLGLFGMLVPPEQGGAGTDAVSYALALEEVARGSGAVATILNNVNAMGSHPLAAFGSDDLKARWLARAVAGEALLAWALAEPGSGSDLSAVATRAEPTGDGYRLTGLKSFVVGAEAATAFLVFAKAPGGLTAFLVPREAPGVRVGDAERSMTLRAATMAQVFLKDVHVPAADRLGAEGDGLKIALSALDASRLGTAAIACGLMAASIEEAKSFASQRTQFRMAIKNFQGIQWKVANMDVELRAARLLTWFAAAKRDKGEDFATDAAAAKLYAAEAAKRVTQDAIRIHGGTGYMRDLPVERLNRDARAMAIYGGTSEMQRAFLAAKALDL